LLQPSEECTHRELDEPQAARTLRHIEAQASLREARAAADVHAARLVLVVADEDERRAPETLVSCHRDPDLEERIAAQRREEGRRECQPLAATQAPLLALPITDHLGIEAQAGVVDADAAVHLADIDALYPSGGDATDCLLELEREPEVLREMIERAEGKNAECRLRVRQHGCDGADRPVTSSRDDDRGAIGECALGMR